MKPGKHKNRRGDEVANKMSQNMQNTSFPTVGLFPIAHSRGHLMGNLSDMALLDSHQALCETTMVGSQKEWIRCSIRRSLP